MARANGGDLMYAFTLTSRQTVTLDLRDADLLPITIREDELRQDFPEELRPCEVEVRVLENLLRHHLKQRQLLRGGNFGKMLVRVGADPS